MLRKFFKFYPSKVDFLIAGVQKGGTSALHDYLALHPQLIPPERAKELHYFTGVNPNLQWYHRQFPKIRYRNRLCFESTPDYICGYSFMADMVRYKARFSKKLKLILVFREPVSRAYSQWNMTNHLVDAVKDPNNEKTRVLRKYNIDALHLYQKMEKLPSLEGCFEIFLDLFSKISPVHDLRQLNQDGLINEIPGQFFVRGLYVFQIKALLDFFLPEEVLILESNELKTNTAETLDKAARFLGISPFRWPESKIGVPRHVSSYGKTIASLTESRIKAFYAPFNEAFFAIAKRDYDWG